MRFDDELKKIVAALPTELKSGIASLNRFLLHHAQRRPEYWLSPVSSSEAAELLGMWPGALRVAGVVRPTFAKSGTIKMPEKGDRG